jgi:hypothetical protein
MSECGRQGEPVGRSVLGRGSGEPARAPVSLTYSVHIRADAERDMERAQDWYAVEAPDQVDRFADELAAVI